MLYISGEYISQMCNVVANCRFLLTWLWLSDSCVLNSCFNGRDVVFHERCGRKINLHRSCFVCGYNTKAVIDVKQWAERELKGGSYTPLLPPLIRCLVQMGVFDLFKAMSELNCFGWFPDSVVNIKRRLYCSIAVSKVSTHWSHPSIGWCWYTTRCRWRCLLPTPHAALASGKLHLNKLRKKTNIWVYTISDVFFSRASASRPL